MLAYDAGGDHAAQCSLQIRSLTAAWCCAAYLRLSEVRNNSCERLHAAAHEIMRDF